MSDLSQFIQDTDAEEVGGEYNWRVYVPRGAFDADGFESDGRYDVQASSEFDAKESCYLHIQGMKGELREW